MQSWFSQNRKREAQFAGQFYPGNRLKLEDALNQYFTDAQNNEEKQLTNNPVRALIAPHAGYVFSGKVAASAYNAIPDNARYKKIFVIASSHRFSFDGAAVYTSGNYETPLGEIKVDSKIANELLNVSPLFVQHNDAHIYEHSLEVQLPFLQHKFDDDFSLVPIILGTHQHETCSRISTFLKKWFTPENLFVISTDFSHYPEYEDAVQIDGATCNAICTNNTNNLLEVLGENKKRGIQNLATSLCGWSSVLTLLHLTSDGNYTFRKCRYMNSGDSSQYGDKKRVVGYWAISVSENDNLFQISEEEKKEMLDKAYTSIKNYLSSGKRSKVIPPQTTGIMTQKMGAFVSIYINDELRGCIGGFAQEKSLNELIQNMAVSALNDRRFDRVKETELENMELEISVLTPLKKVDSIDEIELGKHGIYIVRNNHTGTFLPQVAQKTGWNLEQFLGHCSRDKAGLGWDGWKTAELFTYEAIIFKS